MIGTSTTTLNNEVQMPQVGFGVFQISPGQKTYDAVRTALRLGYRAVDTAAAYENEEDVGRALHDGDVGRKDVFLTTKVWIPDHGYDNTLRAFEQSRAKLGVEMVDLYLIHWPAKKDFAREWQSSDNNKKRSYVSDSV